MSELQTIIDKHVQRVQAGQWQEALSDLGPALSNYPNNFSLMMLAASCHFELGQMREAAVLFGECHGLEPRQTNPLYYGGVAMRKLGMLNECVAAMNMCLKLDPSDFLASGHRGLALLSLGRNDEARPDLRRFLVRMSERSGHLQGKEGEAVVEAVNALKAIGENFPVPGPEELPLLQMLETNQLDQLLQRLARPTSAWHHYFRGDALNSSGKSQEAVVELDQALKLNPLMLDAYRIRGDAYSRFDPARGIEDYKCYLAEADPDAGVVWCNMGGSLRNLKRYPEGVEATKRGLQLLGETASGLYWENLGVCQINTKDFQGCVASMTVALRAGSPQVLYYRACAYDELGQVEQSIEDFEAYLAAGGNQPWAHKRLEQLKAALPKPAAPEKKAGFFSKLFGGKKEEKPSGRPTFQPLEFWQEPVTVKLKAMADKGRWQDIATILEGHQGELRGFYNVQLSEAISGRPAWLETWLKESPNSAAAWNFSGRNAIEWAWEGRGTDWAENVKEEQWKLFHERLELAGSSLMRSHELDPADPNPLVDMITLNMAHSQPIEEAFKLFQHALDRCPDHRGAHRAMMYRLSPKWGGSFEQLTKFRDLVIADLPEGSKMFAIHPWVLAEQLIGEREKRAMSDSARELLVQCYERSLGSSHYKENVFMVWDMNYFAWAFWWAKNYPMAVKVFDRLGDRLSAWPWVNLGEPWNVFQNVRYDCKQAL